MFFVHIILSKSLLLVTFNGKEGEARYHENSNSIR